MTALMDETTGEVVETGAGDEGLERLLEGLKTDLAMANRGRAAAERKMKKLEDELKEQLNEAPEGQTARTIFNLWVRLTNRPKKRTKFGDVRKKAVIARLREGHSAERIMRAVQGAALAANVSSKESERLALIAALKAAKDMLTSAEVETVHAVYRAQAGTLTRYDDLELICRNEVNVERFADLADRVAPEKQVV